MNPRIKGMGKLERKTALVTGANSGIGLATAKQFVNEGAYVFVTGRRHPELATAVKEIGRKCDRRARRCVQSQRSGSPVRANRAGEGQARYRVRQCRCCEIRPDGIDNRVTLCLDL